MTPEAALFRESKSYSAIGVVWCPNEWLILGCSLMNQSMKPDSWTNGTYQAYTAISIVWLPNKWCLEAGSFKWIKATQHHQCSPIPKQITPSRFFCFSPSPSLRSVPEAPSAGPAAPPQAPSLRGPARLSMLEAAERQEGVEAGDMRAALSTVACGLKQLGRASGGMASISRARISSAWQTQRADE